VAIAVAHVAALAMAVALLAARSADAAVASHRDRWPSTRYAALLARSDSLRFTGLARFHAFHDSLIAVARERGDPDLEMVVTIRDATTRGFIESQFDTAVARTRRWLGPIRAARDTVTLCFALRTIGYADLARERYDTSLITYRELLTAATRARLPVFEGYAMVGTSFIALSQGRFKEAERGYRIAVRKFEGREAYGGRTARAGLAHALLKQGRIEEARTQYERVVADARAARDLRNEAEALNDLATIELGFGDPSGAAAVFRECARVHRSLGLHLRALQSSRNVALCLASQRRLDEQAAVLDSLVQGAQAIGASNFAALCLTDLALIRRRQGRYGEARAFLERVTLLPSTLALETRLQAVTERVRLESADGHPEAAARIGKQALDSLGTGGTPHERAALLNAQGHALLDSGDAAGALAPMRASVSALSNSSKAGGGSGLITCEASLALAFSRLGRLDSAIVHYRRATTIWERTRAAPSDLAWRQSFDRLPAELFGPLGAALLDPARGASTESRAADAFAMVQRFRARTLEDAVRGAEGSAELPRVSVAALRRALRPGEVLLDVFATPDTTFLFAVTREAIQVGGTAGSTPLLPRLRRLRDLIESGESEAATVAAAAADLGGVVLGPVAESLRRARTILISSGSLAAFPLGMLRLPGEPEPLAARRVVALVPSATLLAAARATRPDGSDRSGLTALTRTTDAGGVRLEGVARESRWLARRFPAGRVVTNDGTRALDAMLASLKPSEVLHVSSHARTPTAAPWSAGFLLGRGAGNDAYLTASRISRLKRPARVCVLASCTSVGAAGRGETLPDLASAWLEAGTSTVVATLWTVDDQATARFVEDFYEALARGITTGEAMRAAQRVAIASRDRSAERFWGGFVLFGDPATRVDLGATVR
jgi:CHAT domain-containing protein/tetratricopeptide (TPR) repeat protein